MSGDAIKAFGLVIKTLRHAQNLSQEALAFEASIDRTFLSQLETGRKQPEAIALYQKSGYRLTENYGQYVGVENSVCMRIDLKG